MNKKDFLDGLIGLKNISQIEIIYFSQNFENLFDDFDINNKNLKEQSNIILNILTDYLPCSLPIIEEYLKKFYGYPNRINNSSQLLFIYSTLLNKGLDNYKKIIENLNCDSKNSKFLKEYDNNLSLYKKQEANFKEVITLHQREESLEKTIADISAENRILENEEIGDLKSTLETLKDILSLDRDNKKIIADFRENN
ncbi:hypothetical protein [Cetobacterium sp. SF1]|uniref:hypothetical protein n=1 Tax=Cetobacterium sp. SF1 TaxID=3417654 RepID=UPI003CE6A4B0